MEPCSRYAFWWRWIERRKLVKAVEHVNTDKLISAIWPALGALINRRVTLDLVLQLINDVKYTSGNDNAIIDEVKDQTKVLFPLANNNVTMY